MDCIHSLLKMELAVIFFANERDMKIAINGYPPNGGKWDHAAYEPSVFAKAIETARKESTAAAD